MWCAYLTSHSVAENLAKNRTSVVRAFLNARYYNSAQGQFLSEDPVFLGNPKSQVLTDPQSMNSYNYANGNPITKSDPNGKAIALAPVMYGLGDFGLASTVEFWGPPVAIGAGAAVAAIGAYSLAQNIYPGPGMNYQTYKLATENSYRTDPEPNGNWKGPLGIGIIGIGAWSLLNDK